MSEHMNRIAPHLTGKQGYEGYLNWRVAALSEILQDSGYHTIMSGKWYVGICARYSQAGMLLANLSLTRLASPGTWA